MSRLLRARALVALAAAALLVVPASALAQAWPGKPLRIIVAGSAGATADITARMLAEGLRKEIGQPVVVDAKPGGAGAIAVNELLAMPRDGHTVLVGVNSLVSEIPHIIKLKFDMAQSIVPLAELARGGLVLVGTPALPPADLAALVAYAKANPGKLNYASYSPGTMSHILGLQLNKAAGIDLVHVGYKGSTPALTDVMAGHVPLMFDGMPTALPLIRSGKLKAYAVSTPTRSPLLPQVPTFRELGYPQLETVAWMGLWCSPEVPAAVQGRLRDAALRVMSQPLMRERLQEVGFEPGLPRSSADLQRGLRADYERVGAMLKAIGFKPD
jgi:tripartite-type tricarboxylate transporter receptor subunit TctC